MEIRIREEQGTYIQNLVENYKQTKGYAEQFGEGYWTERLPKVANEMKMALTSKGRSRNSYSKNCKRFEVGDVIGHKKGYAAVLAVRDTAKMREFTVLTDEGKEEKTWISKHKTICYK